MKLDIQLFADAEVSIKFDNKVTGEGKLQKYAETLTKINSVVSGMDAGVLKQMESSANNMQQIDSSATSLKNKAHAAFDYLALTKYSGAIKKLGASFTNLAKQSFDYLENFNLFQVAFQGNYASAEKFVNKMSEMYGLDESWVVKTTGHFKQLSNAMGITAETGEKVSKLLTQMSLDISSLYNVDIERAASTLSSAMAGQTKPIRGVAGGDITQATLQTTLDKLDIDRTVNQLSFAEKRLLIIISLTEQLKGSINDMGRTIESPSNQLRIMNEQWERLSRAVGNVFLPILAKILPYLNAILMVLTEIINLFAKFVQTLLGFSDSDFDYFDEASVSMNDFGNAAKGATASVKKLKQGLRGFDKLNNITTPSAGSGGGGIGAGVGGINPKLLDAFNAAYDDYQKQLDEVEMKATKIRDKIMEWLGFTKLVDDETGDVSFKFDHITGGTVLGALAVGGTIFKGVSMIFKILKNIGFLKFPLLSKLFGGLFGSKAAGGVSDALNGAGSIGEAANSNAKSLKIPSVKTILLGLADLAIIVAGLTVLMLAIGGLMSIKGFKEATTRGIQAVIEVFTGIGKILIPLALVTAGILGMGTLGTAGIGMVLAGLGDLGLVIAGSTALITLIGMLSGEAGGAAIDVGISATTKVFEGIAKILIPLALVTAGLITAGLTGGAGALAILAGLGDLALIMAGTTAVVTGMGILSELKFVKDNLDNGIDLIVKLFEGLGRIAGAIIGGLVSEALGSIGKSLPEFGENLALFMQSASPFFDKVVSVNTDVAQSVGYLADAILKLTAAQVLRGLTGWFSKRIPLSEFGEQLEEFGPSFKSFANDLNGIPKTTVEKTKITAEAMLILIDMANKIPNQGGLLAALVGDNTLGDFAKMLPNFGSNFADFSKKVAGTDSKVVEKSKDIKDAMLNIIEFAKKIPNEGGLASFFAGDNGLKAFGESLKSFGASFKSYADSVSKIDIANVNNVTNSISAIVDSAKKIKDNGLGKTIKDFGENLKDSAKSISSFYSTAFSEDAGKSAGNSFGKGIAKGIKSQINSAKIKLTLKDGDKVVGSKYSFTATAAKGYAQGGLPPVGQMFIANERGPELVGQIGGQSFVANQNQVVDLLDRKLGEAKANPINATFVIQVGNRELAKQVINDLQDMARTNGKPITIGN